MFFGFELAGGHLVVRLFDEVVAADDDERGDGDCEEQFHFGDSVLGLGVCAVCSGAV